jgi:hypothetical protein
VHRVPLAQVQRGALWEDFLLAKTTFVTVVEVNVFRVSSSCCVFFKAKSAYAFYKYYLAPVLRVFYAIAISSFMAQKVVDFCMF